MKDEKLIELQKEKEQFLVKLRFSYFASSHLYFKNYMKANKLSIPDEYGITIDHLLHWNQEKREYLERTIETIQGLKEKHISTLLMNLDMVAALQEKVFNHIVETSDVRELATLTKALSDSYNLYEKIMLELEIDTVQDNTYQDNRDAVDDLLKKVSSETDAETVN